MLREHHALNIASEMLDPDDFYVPLHRRLFTLILSLASEHGRVDRAILGERLRRDGLWDGEHGALVIALVGRALSSNIEQHCGILIRLSAERAIMRETLELSECRCNPTEAAARLAKLSREVVGRLKEPSGRADKALKQELQAAVDGVRYALPMPWERMSLETRALLPGTVTVLCGSPGSTKSLMMAQLVTSLAGEYRVAVLVLEDGVTYHLRRVLAQVSGCAEITDDAWCRTHADEVARKQVENAALLTHMASVFEQPEHNNGCTADELIFWVRLKADQGARLICIDPITMMAKGPRSFQDEERFLVGSKRVIEETGASLFLVTHPRKLPFGSRPGQCTMDDIAGSVSFSRFSQTLLLLLAHDDKESSVESGGCAGETTHNRTVTICKARNGRGVEGRRLAFDFSRQTLQLRELGLIRRKVHDGGGPPRD